jgi:hypothetical protein
MQEFLNTLFAGRGGPIVIFYATPGLRSPALLRLSEWARQLGYRQRHETAKQEPDKGEP